MGVSKTQGVHVGVAVDRSRVGNSKTMNPVALGVAVGNCAAEVAVAAIDVSVAKTPARAVAIGGSKVAVGRAVTGVVTPTIDAAGVPPATIADVGVGLRVNWDESALIPIQPALARAQTINTPTKVPAASNSGQTGLRDCPSGPAWSHATGGGGEVVSPAQRQSNPCLTPLPIRNHRHRRWYLCNLSALRIRIP